MPEAELLALYKEEGETPLECIARLVSKNPQYSKGKVSYAGRLDPMAEGLLLVLVGDQRKKSEYLMLDKTYEFEVLWGVSTDTYDILGIVQEIRTGIMLDERRLKKAKDAVSRLRIQEYPPFSSRTVGGKPLWELARENKIGELEMPTRSIKVFDIQHIHTRSEDGESVLADVERRVKMVKGDFRQKEILNAWNKKLRIRNKERFLISKFLADVSSGTYVRGLANEMGRILGVPALAYSIKRTRIGGYRI